jgi:hypothetical protein
MNIEATDTSDLARFISKLGLSVRATNVLTHMGLESVEKFAALDQRTLLGRRNCGKKTAAEILEAVAKHKPLMEVASTKQNHASCLSAAMERTPVTDLRLSVRAMGALDRLKISTVAELAKISDRELLGLTNFGKRSLREVQSQLALLRERGIVLWPTENQPATELSRAITRAARKLRRLKSAPLLLCDDPRFGHLIREMHLGAKNAREAANMIVSRKADPVDPHPLVRRLANLVRILQIAGSRCLEAELWNLTDGLGGDRNRKIIVSYLGWGGKPPRTLEAVSRDHRMTRERVRQICARIEKVRSTKPFAPALDRALRAVTRAAPTLAEEIEAEFFRSELTKTGFSVESLAAAARDLGRQPGFAIEIIRGHRVVVSSDMAGFLDRIEQVARGAIRHWGVATVEDVAAATNVAVSLCHKFLPLLEGFKWLDQPSGWFWIENLPRNSLLTQIRKILAACPNIDVSELRTGVGRHHRRKGFTPPRRVLLELCRQLPWCRVDCERIVAVGPLSPDEALSGSERIILRILNEHGPVIQRTEFAQRCLEAGMNHHTFWVFLSYCPLICRHATGVYGLRGAEVPVGLVERLVPKGARNSKLLIDYGWIDNQNLQILYRISEGMLSNGIVSIPGALKPFIQGAFTLVTSDDCKVGMLTAKDNSGWGLGPFFRRRGGEPGDYLSVVFDLSCRKATVQIGDASFTDRLQDPPPIRSEY